MPGLVGFVCEGMERRYALSALGEMAALATDPRAHVWDAPFCDDEVCAMRSHLGIAQAAPQPYVDEGVHVWMEGEIFNADDVEAAWDEDSAHRAGGQPGLLVCTAAAAAAPIGERWRASTASTPPSSTTRRGGPSTS